MIKLAEIMEIAFCSGNRLYKNKKREQAADESMKEYKEGD